MSTELIILGLLVVTALAFDFTNGFHGFPTRGGSQLLWTNSLGTRVTYGCILISNDHIRQLYDWAEDGVVVQITP